MTERQNLKDLPSKYRIIYADPPWLFRSWSKKGEGKSAQNHYSCMTMDEIASLPVGEIAADNCILFLWITAPLLSEQLKIISAWGFEYKTIAFDWCKLNKKQQTPFMGLGYYTRANMEHVLLATKGKPGRPKKRNISSVIYSPIREHSRKPDEVRINIEQMYDGPRIELFARQEYPGWDCWGNEVNKFNTLWRHT